MNNANSQVWGVDFIIEFNIETCNYDAKLIVVDGNAFSFQDRAQFNAQYTVVVPQGTTLTIDTSYAPYTNNIFGDSDTPMEWSINSTIDGPAADPTKAFYAMIPDLSASFLAFNNLLEGDTIKLFGFSLDPFECDGFVRPFDPALDPSSATMDGNGNYANGYTIGDVDQDYLDYHPTPDLPKPAIDFEINCAGDVTIIPTPIDSLTCSDQFPYSYEWSGPNGFYSTDEMPIIPTGNGSGEYCTTIVDNFGCDTIICKMLIVEDPEIITETLCGTDPYTLTYSAGGSGTWSFDPTSNMTGASIGSTSNGDAEVTFTGSATGLYSFIYENDGCGGTAEVTLVPGGSEPDITNDGPKCEGEITTLTTANISGATYEWFDIDGSTPIGSNSNTLDVTDEGIYTLTVTVGGCPATATETITYKPTPNTPTLGVNSPACVGDAVNFTASNITGASDSDYTWTGPNNYNEQNPTINSVSLSDAGDYECYVTVDGCESLVATISLVVEDKATTPSIDAVGDLCVGGALNLNSNTSANTYTWTHVNSGSTYNGQSPTIDPISSADDGEWILVINDGGCDSEPASITITINDKPDTPTIDATSPVCVGEIIYFTGGNVAGASDWHYYWTGPNDYNEQHPTINSASLSDAGEYTLVVEIDGCESDEVTITVEVNDTAPAPSASVTTPVCEDDNVDFVTDAVSEATYNWTQVSGGSNSFTTTDATHTINNVTSDYDGDWELEVNLNGCISEAAIVTLVINDTPDTPAPTSNTDVCVDETIELYANTTATSYSWFFDGFEFSNDQDPTIGNATSDDEGEYILYVTVNGCTSLGGSTIVVVNDTPETPTASSNSSICSGDDIELYSDPIADATYTWINPTGIEFYGEDVVVPGSSVNAIAGEWELYVTVDGCDSELAMTTISINPTPATPIISSNQPLCSGNDLELYTDPVAGNVVYIWTGPNGWGSSVEDPFYENVPPEGDGVYQLIVEVDGCPSAPATINVDIYETPETPTAESNSPICIGDDINLTSVVSDASVNYSWTGPSFSSTEANPTITGATAANSGDYILIVSKDGCDSEESTVTVVVNPLPTITADATDLEICVGESTTISAMGGDSYTWNEGLGAGDSHEVSPTTTTTYTVEGTDANGCINTATVTITVNPLPTVTADTTDLEICIGANTTISAMGADTYDWTTPALGAGSSHEVTPTETTTYEVTGTDANGCENSATVTITVNPLPTVTATASDLEICLGESTTISGGGASTYIWDEGLGAGDSHEVSPTATTTYTVTGLDDNGCENTATVTIIVNPLPTVTADATDLEICVGESTTISAMGADTYDWTTPALGAGSSHEVTPTETTTYTVVGTDANGCENTAEVTITVNPLPIVTADATLLEICIGGSTTISAMGADTYDWTTPALGAGSSHEVTPTETTTYTVIGTDANGCENTAEVTITVNPLPTVTATASDLEICLGESTTISGGGASTYTWDEGLGAGDSHEVSPSATTTYTVTGLDDNGCENTATVTITVNPLPTVTADATDLEICVGESTTISAMGADTYDWTTPALGAGSSHEVTPTETTTYTVVGTDANGCENTAEVTITVNPLPIVTADATLLEICIGGSTTISAMGADTYDWTTPALGAGSSHEVTPTETTTYTVIGTDANGCENTAEVTIIVNPLPTVTATSIDLEICLGESTTISGGGASTYTWDEGLGAGDSHEVSPSATTTYTVTGLDDNGCENTATVTITVNPLPTVTATASDLEICIGESSTISASGADSYDWTQGLGAGDSHEVSPTTTTTYAVVGTDANGCENTAEVTITVNPLPTVTATATDLEICIGSSTTISASGADSYDWTPGLGAGDSHEVSPTTTTTYEVTGTDANGCENTAEVTITVNPLPTVTAIASDLEVCVGDVTTLTASGAETYDWGPLGFGENKDVSPTETTTYTVTGTDGNNCENTATVTITVNPLPEIVTDATDFEICVGETTTISASGADDFDWGPLGSGSSHNVSPTTTTTYDVVGTDANGCENIGQVTIIVNDLPSVAADATDLEICVGQSTEIFGLGGVSYTWNEGLGDGENHIISPASTTDYTVTVTDNNGCENTATVTIIVNPLPTVTADASELEICVGDITTLTASGATSYLWAVSGIGENLGAGENKDVSPDVTTTYEVTGTDGNGCQNTATVTITVNELPDVDAGTYADVCMADGPFLIEGTPNGGTFSGNGVSSDGTMFDPNLSGTGTHTISYIYENPTTGCSDIATTEITVIATPDAPIVSSNSPVCEGETISISVEDVVNGQFMWTGPNGLVSTEQNLILTNSTENQEGIYRVKVTVDGCDSEWAEIEVIVNPIPEIQNLTSNSAICEGETIQLMVDAVDNAEYAWSGPDGMTSDEQNPTVENATSANAGAYCLIITVDGCESEFACTDVVVNPIPPAPEVSASAPVCIGSDISFSSTTDADSYQWFDNNNDPFSTDQYPVLTGSTLGHNGDWSLVVTIDGCISDAAIINVVVNDLPTVDAGTYADMCEDEEAITLVGSPENGMFMIGGVEVTSFDPADYGVGPQTIDYVYSDLNGCSNSASTTITVNATPTITNVSTDCSSDLITYTISFESTGTVTAAPFAVSGNQVTGIPISEGVMLISTIGDCEFTQSVSPPNCDCDEVAPAISDGDQEVCVGSTNPQLAATVDAGVRIDWYADATGGSPLVLGSPTFDSPEDAVGVYTYYAEARTEPDQCTSTTRTPVTLTIKGLPMITNTDLTDEICSEDMSSGFELMSDEAGTQYEWTAVATDAAGNEASGVGNIPAKVLTSTVSQGSVVYTVTPILNGCAGTPVDFTVLVNQLPEITIDNKECSADLETYTISFTSDFDVTATPGTVGAGIITDIPKGETVTITVNNSSTGCSTEVQVTAPDCDCAEVELPVSDGPVAICVEGDAEDLSVTVGSNISVQWFSSEVGGSPLASGTSITPSETTVGVYSYYAEATNDITGCVSTSRTEVVYTINALPTISIDSKECSADLLTYTIVYTSDASVSVTNGTQTGNEVVVTAGESTTLIVTDVNTGCIDMVEVSAPNCDCSEVPSPISGGDETICDGETIPTLSVSIDAGNEANWYDAPTGGLLIAGGANTITFLPTNTIGTQIFYVEASNPLDGCVSNTRTEVSLTINALPTFTVGEKTCSDDLSSYDVIIATDGVVDPSHGTWDGTAVVGIQSGQDITVTIVSTDGCEIIETISAPVCDCAAVLAPISGGDETICEYETIPTLTVAVDAGNEANWYDSASGGTIISGGANTLTYLPSNTIGTQTFYVEAVNPTDGCVSPRTEVSFTINAMPTYTQGDKPCSADLSSYDVVIDTDGDVDPSEGIWNGTAVVGIQSGMNITVTITSPEGCERTETITAPVCDCSEVPAPLSAGNEVICDGETVPTLSVSVDAGHEANWYDAGGSLLPGGANTLTYQPTNTVGVQTLYVEASNPSDGCISNTRTEVSLTINAMPSFTEGAKSCSDDLSMYDVTIITDGNVDPSHGTWDGTAVVGIQSGQDITVTITNAAGCELTETITAPVCACDPIDAPVASGAEICVGETTPLLTGTVGTDETIDWYAADCTTLLSTGLTFQSPEFAAGTYTYCLQARNTNDNCTSDMTTTITLVINELPTYSEGAKSCSDDLSMYDVTIITDGDVVSSHGSWDGTAVVGVQSGQDITVTITNAAGCEIIESITAPVCACDDIVEPIIVANDPVCFNETNTVLEVSTITGTSVTWWDQAVDGTELSNTTTYTSPETDPGTYTYFVEATEDVTGCKSDRIPVIFIIHALPTISVDAKECAADMLTYSVTFSGDVTLTNVTGGGTISGMMIIDIPADTDIMLTFTDNVTGCENTQMIDAPNCDCDDVDAPISNGNEEICFGESNPELSVSDVLGMTFNWYSESTGGDLLGTGPTYTPLEDAVSVHSYYVEAINDADGCMSNTRTLITLTINDLPTLTEDTKECSADLSSYSVSIITDADVIVATPGDVSGNTISNIPANTPVVITVTNSTTGCSEIFTIEAPVCDCAEVVIPTVTNEVICLGETNPFLTASTTSENTIDWYDAQVGGNELENNESAYQLGATTVGVHTVWAQVRNIDSGCVSDRVPATLTINALPEIDNFETACTADLSMYSVTLTTNANITSVTPGTISGNVITDITAGTDVVVSLEDPITGCTSNVTIESPNCDCSDVANPISAGDLEICFGETMPVMEVTAVSGVTFNWYADAVTTSTLLENSAAYTPTTDQVGAHTVYVDATDNVTNCTSDRIPVTLTINALPNITNVDPLQEICSGDVSQEIVLTADLAGTTFSWTATAENVTGHSTSGNGNINIETLVNDTDQEGRVTYTVIPTSDGCEGLPVEFIVIVNPAAKAGADQTLSCYIDAEFIMNSVGNGSWSPANANAQEVIIEDPNSNNSTISGFTHAGKYDFMWTMDGCSDMVSLEILDDCPCIIESNNVIDNTAGVYCMTTGELILLGEEALPLGGDYMWEVSINDTPFVPAAGINNTVDYDASNLTNGNYKFRRMYNLITDAAVCSEVSNEVEFLVFTDKIAPGEIMFTPNPVCSGDTLFLEVENYNPELTYNWTISSGNARLIYALDSMSSIVVESSGTVTLSVTQSFDGCVEALESAPTTLDIEIFATPQPQLGLDTTFCELDATYFLTPGDFEEYLWQDGSDDVDFEVEGEGIYSVEVTDTLGCVGTDEIDIKSFCCDFAWPNIFKADGRGANSEFSITDVYGCAITSKLYIFDRWGNLVYQGEDTTTWDGFYKGKPVAQGVYVFIYEYSAMSADREIFEDKLTGDITVIRDR